VVKALIIYGPFSKKEEEKDLDLKSTSLKYDEMNPPQVI
jgi:hypothetical protein